MKKVISLIIFLSFLFFLSGCTNFSSENKSIVTNVNKQSNSNENKAIPFQYFFRGFITLKENQAELYPHDSYIIGSNKDWHDFMDKYVPGIPYEVSVDYSKECLVFSVLFPAKPTYTAGADIETFVLDGNKLEPEYKNGTNGLQNNIYAQNTDSIEHCFVNIVKIKKSAIPGNPSNIYHKGAIIKN